MREQLEDIRAWAHAKVQDGRDPPWTWYQYMKLIETVNAILKAMDAATAAAGSQSPASRLIGTPRKRTISAREVCVMDNQENVVGARPSAAERPQESGAAALGRGGRMSRQRKTAAVLRLLRGEDLETVSRELGVTAATLTGWHDAFLAAGEAALTTRAATGEELESDRLKARLGAALIERDLLNEKIAILEAGRPFARRRRAP